MAGTLYRLTGAGKGQLRERGSRFLAFAQPVSDPGAARAEWVLLKKAYPDARHHVCAWRLGEGGDTEFAHDDGEPRHSAGDPILAAIRAASLTEVLVVVARYFGGTKLGVRGLIDAYREAAALALADAPCQLVVPLARFSLSFSYAQTSEVNRMLHPYRPEVLASRYDTACQITCSVEKNRYPELASSLQEAGFEPTPEPMTLVKKN